VQITALLYERRLGAAEVEKARAAAERRMAQALEGDGSELEAAAEALAKARAGLEALGTAENDPTFAAVLVMEERQRTLVAERAARAEAESTRRRKAAEAALKLAEEHLAGGRLLEARTAHGLAAAELELAGTLVPQLQLHLLWLLSAILVPLHAHTAVSTYFYFTHFPQTLQALNFFIIPPQKPAASVVGYPLHTLPIADKYFYVT
jgi:hypothetical protein